jgi:hypothetical protein
MNSVRKFIEYLELLNIPRTMIRLQYHAGNRKRPESRDALLEKIVLMTGINTSQIVMLPIDVKGQRYLVNDSLGVQVLAGATRRVANQKTSASFGVRYALTLLAIVRGVMIWPDINQRRKDEN